MAKHAAKIHFHVPRYLTREECCDPISAPPTCGRPVSRKMFASAFDDPKTSGLEESEAIRYAAIAAPNRTEIAAIEKVRPPPTIPRIRPQTVEKLTKVSPAESHFIATPPCLSWVLSL